MKTRAKTCVAPLAGLTLDMAAVNGVQARSGPPTYAIIDVSGISDPTGYAAIGPNGSPSVTAFGAKETWSIEEKTSKSRIFVVEGLAP